MNYLATALDITSTVLLLALPVVFLVGLVARKQRPVIGRACLYLLIGAAVLSLLSDVFGGEWGRIARSVALGMFLYLIWTGYRTSVRWMRSGGAQ